MRLAIQEKTNELFEELKKETEYTKKKIILSKIQNLIVSTSQMYEERLEGIREEFIYRDLIDDELIEIRGNNDIYSNLLPDIAPELKVDSYIFSETKDKKVIFRHEKFQWNEKSFTEMEARLLAKIPRKYFFRYNITLNIYNVMEAEDGYQFDLEIGVKRRHNVSGFENSHLKF